MSNARGVRPGADEKPSVISGESAGSRRIWVEIPDAEGPSSAWCYTDKRSYLPSDTVTLFISSTETSARVRIRHDGGHHEELYDSEVDTRFQPLPDRSYRDGCDWLPTAHVVLPHAVAPGCYLVELSSCDDTPRTLGHHLFVVKPQRPRERAVALILTTSTWAAYNDWGGANHYFGVNPGTPRGRSPVLSAQRPWARGQVWLPQGAPRMLDPSRPRRPQPARYGFVEWAYLNGYSKYYAAAGWPTFEKHFVAWAERQGFVVDLYTQDDLHANPDFLAGYRCAAIVGHDEYWTAQMRSAIDGYVERGGRVARFAGNFTWQIRLEDGGQRQIAYKYDAREHDPEAGRDRAKISGAWEDPWIDNPGATTFGVNALRGMYAGFGGMAPRAARGFTVYRPAHWAFDGTGLGYADMFGDESSIFGFEVDGLDYEFRDGLPYPTFTDGAPAGTEILAMNWATAAEDGSYPESFMIGDGDAQFRAAVLDQDDPEGLARSRRASGMVVAFGKGAGEVFTAGTCEWVNGLRSRDHAVETITSNVLTRFLEN
ncbi:N,N-dimethylformamidase beta subunit family domain-containing protein [Mycolicibacterium sp.]|uniref:N,N-dimethylformamidase beta subunit family domain-containing protein n=1 Tax=Mycolicibacterium sp. TaxID=2320850 RepID=UPI003D1406AC